MLRTVFRNPIARGAMIVGGLAILAIGWWLGSPLLIDDEVDEAFPLSASAQVPPDMTQEEVEAEMLLATEASDSEMSEEMPEMPEGPIVLATGAFSGADDFHQGSGTATIYELDDGSSVLRLEDFDVTNGPDLHVLLVPNAEPSSREDVTGYVDLGSLKGNVGSQNYEIPADINIADYGSVVIYCEPFHVIFASAPIPP